MCQTCIIVWKAFLVFSGSMLFTLPGIPLFPSKHYLFSCIKHLFSFGSVFEDPNKYTYNLTKQQVIFQKGGKTICY